MNALNRTPLFALLLAACLPLAACTTGVGSGSDNVTDDPSAEPQAARPQFELFQGDDGLSYFRLKAANGEIVMASEAYESEAGAENGIESAKENGVDLANFEQRESEDGQFYWVLKAQNGEIIGVSETYVSPSNAQRGAEDARETVAKVNRLEAADEGGAHFQLFVGEDEQHYFNLTAANGEIVMQSEAYESTAGAINGTESCRLNGRDAANFELREAVDGQWYFVLKAQNHEIIGVSETYVSKSNAERGVEDVVALIRSERLADAAEEAASEE